MYHIKPDKRSRTSARLIGDAMLALLEKKRFDSITIVDIQKESTVSRATFYRLFDQTEDVLEWLYEEQIQEVKNSYIAIPRENRPPFTQYFLNFYYDNSMLAEQLIRAQKIGVFLRVHQRNFRQVLELSDVSGEVTAENGDYYAATFTALLVAYLLVWMAHRKKETPDEMNQIIREQINVAIRILS